MTSLTPSIMTSLPLLLWRHYPLYYDVTSYYDVTNASTMISLPLLLWRHYPLYYDVTSYYDVANHVLLLVYLGSSTWMPCLFRCLFYCTRGLRWARLTRPLGVWKFSLPFGSLLWALMRCGRGFRPAWKCGGKTIGINGIFLCMYGDFAAFSLVLSIHPFSRSLCPFPPLLSSLSLLPFTSVESTLCLVFAYCYMMSLTFLLWRY